MKITIKTIVESRESLQWILNEKLPANLAYRVNKNVRPLDRELKEYDNAIATMLKNGYGEKVPGTTNQYRVVPEKADAFQAEVEALLQEEVEIPFTPIPIESFQYIKPIDIIRLGFMLLDPQEE